MKLPTVYFLLALSVLGQTTNANEPPSTPLTEEEALSIVQAQMDQKAASELARKQRILGIDAEAETVVDHGSHKTILRRVNWQPVEPLVADAATVDNAPAEFPVESQAFEEVAHSMISFGATVYDDTYTEITWREPNVSGAKPFILWANVNFKYMGGISSFDRDNVHYSYFGFIHSVDTSAYIVHPETGEHIYPQNLPDWIPSSADFPTDEPSYLILVDDLDTEIPELLYQQIDALLLHFSENKETLVAKHQRAEALSKAKAKFEAETPEEKPDVIINYWPIKSNADL